MSMLLRFFALFAAMAAMNIAHATGVAPASGVSFTINESDPANPTPHIHLVDLRFDLDPTYGVGGIDANGFSRIDYTTLTGTFTVPESGSSNKPYTLLHVSGLKPGDFVGASGQLNDNLFKYEPGNYFTSFGLAFIASDGAHTYNIYENAGDLNGCTPHCGTGTLVVTDFNAPLPAAAWLFGSALATLGISAKRRRQGRRLP